MTLFPFEFMDTQQRFVYSLGRHEESLGIRPERADLCSKLPQQVCNLEKRGQRTNATCQGEGPRPPRPRIKPAHQ
jgi:hypothetical protein